ncbi:MAG: hypothetical protein P1V20_22240 [Verrucomicrobiales bacterium]|nr:hypothetical protein [Verrucomicrobiales bacterium]
MIRVWLPAVLALFYVVVKGVEATEVPIAKPDKFPPPAAAHYLAGELTFVDHINRILYLRPDRTNREPKAFQDLPLKVTMLPYGSVRYHGASAQLHDIPLGTHLHGLFYPGPEGAYEMKAPGYPDRPDRSFDSPFSQCLQLEDDFSYYQTNGGKWIVESVDTEKKTITAKQKNSETGLTFECTEATRVWSKDDAFGGFTQIKPGQEILFNVTIATRFCPGRLTEVWIDPQSIELATATQKQINAAWHRERGIPGMIKSIEHATAGKGTVTAVVYAGTDPDLIAQFTQNGGIHAAPAEPSLRIYGINAAPGRIDHISQIDNPPPGHSGTEFTFTVNELLEGIRSGRTVWLAPGGRTLPTKPREELLHHADIWPKPYEEIAIETTPVDPPDKGLSKALPDSFPTGKPVYLSGELTGIDHVNRRGILRLDRSDNHNKYYWDLPNHFQLLPYGSIYYHGSPAALRDIPVGTHLHGWFYLGKKGQFSVPLLETNYSQIVSNQPNEYSPDSMWCAAFRLEDDFTFYHNRNSRWQVTAIDLKAQKLTMKRLNRVQSGTVQGTVADSTGYNEASGLSGTQKFDLSSGTRVWKNRNISRLDEITVDDTALINFTWATLYGPGVLLDIWLDDETINAAEELQNRRHFQYLTDRGVPALITSTENRGNGKGFVYATLYSSPAKEALNSFQENTSALVAPADHTLRTYEHVNDNKPGRFIEITRQENAPPGSSGISLKMEFGEMLEGFRPGRSIRIFMRHSPRRPVPREERLWPLDVRPPVHTGPGD